MPSVFRLGVALLRPRASTRALSSIGRLGRHDQDGRPSKGYLPAQGLDMTIMKELLLATATCLAFVGMANACGGTTTPKACYARTYDRTHLAKHPYQSVAAMRIALSPSEPPYDFDLDVQFREDKDEWSWNAWGICQDYGPGLNCGIIKDGCEPTGDGRHFYITKNQKALYLYPNEIQLEGAKKVGKWGDQKVLTEGNDDKIFRLDKTVCWKEQK
jgi:hypothetical protein